MAIPAGSVRLSIQGHLFGGDIFNYSHWFWPVSGGTSVPSTNSAAATLLNNLTTGSEWSAYMTALLGGMRAATGVDQAVLYSYPTPGPSASAQAAKSIAANGTSTLGTLPNQICRVVTLNTNQSGRSYRGRVYLPASGLAMDTSTGLFSASPASLLSAIAAWMVAKASSEGLYSAVVSPTRSARTSVVSLKTDQRPDVQRRRANREAVGTSYTQAVVY